MNLELLQQIMLSMTQELSPHKLLQLIVDELTSERIGFALTRIWVKAPGDRCSTCRFAEECPDRTECLHLVASAGRSLEGGVIWNATEGPFSRFPLGRRKIGLIGQTGESVFLPNIQEQTEGKWLVDPEWAKREAIKSFAGHPLLFRGEVLGVIGIFCRKGLSHDASHWLRLFADQAAIAIANARAFDEITRLKAELEAENTLLKEEFLGSTLDPEIIGSGAQVSRLLEQVKLVAPTEAAILIEGESGTGKELVARALHRNSRRAEKPLIKVNCAAIPRELFESEFFGHVKGAFTGAIKDRIGRFQLADRGTLFLDEVGEIPLELQSKLLRILQEGEFERIGEAITRKVNVRIIAATNRDLKKESELGRFREDLYYRLGVFPISVPPLRERMEDLPALLNHFLKSSAQRLNVPAPKVPAAELDRLREYLWPGNIRELSHVVERAVIMAKGGRVNFDFMNHQPKKTTVSVPTPVSPGAVLSERTVREMEIDNIRKALEQAEGRIYGPGGAAEILGIPPTTLTSRIRRWGI